MPFKNKKQLLIVALLAASAMAFSQSYTLPNAFAHNDYRHKRPLLDALDNGFTYVEADVYLRNNQLIVAHILPFLKKKRTLEALYLKPLLDYVQSNDLDKEENRINNCPLTLLIDIKSDANKTYTALLILLEKYKSILSGYEDGQTTFRNVTIVLSGHKPYELVKQKDSRYVFMDEDLKKASEDSTNNMFPMASCKYSSLLKWKGKGMIPEIELHKLEYYVTQAHNNGRKVRLWASPENKMVWSELLKCNVDLINTDRLKSLRKFLLANFLELAKKETTN